MKTILLIEDDLITHKLVKHSLGNDFNLISCYSLEEASKILTTDKEISLIILDRNLPDGDGLSICYQLRQESLRTNIPIIFLSSAIAETDKVTAFFAGADDYITKPFGLMELKARVQVRLKKSSSKLFISKLEVDLDSHRTVIHHTSSNQSEIPLTRIEFQILITFAQSIDQVFSRENLLAKVWGSSTNVSDRVIDSHISHLRKKISAAGLQLESLRGEGYRMTLAKELTTQTA